MRDPSDPLHDPPHPPGEARWGRRPRGGGADVPWAPIVIVVLLAGAGLWWWLSNRPAEEAPQVAMDEVPAAVAPMDTTVVEGPPPPLDLPALARSDGILRELVGALSRHPRWTSWLVTDELATRFVGAVVAVAAGVSPAPQVPFMAPEGRFRVQDTGRGEVIDPASYRRYDGLTDAFVSFDTRGAVRLYQQLLPLFDEAHRGLGFPPGTFGETLAAAIDRILEVEVPDTPPGVRLDVQTYLFTDPELEAASPVARQVLRMGPDNARRVQLRLRELRGALVAAGALPAAVP